MGERIAVTGASGFLGRHLVERLAQDHDVVGVGLRGAGSPEPTGSGRSQGAKRESISEQMRRTEATVVVHAGFANRKPEAWTDAAYLTDSIGTTVAVADAAEALGARLMLVSSSAVYGHAQGQEVMTEATPLAPVSLYGSAKAVQEMTLAHRRPGGVPVTVMRLFNLIGPGQQPGMLVPDWIMQARAVLDGTQQEMRIGHARSGRDFVDVRDAAAAIARMVEAPVDPWPVFNVCSGRVLWLRDLLTTITELAGREIPVVEAVTTLATDDVRVQRGSYDKLAATTGWSPTREAISSVRDAWQHIDSGN